MILIIKENQSLLIEEQELKNEYSASIKATEIKTKAEIQEVIHQCQLVESKLTDELDGTQSSLESLTIREVLNNP